MRKVTVKASKTYDVLIGRDLLQNAGSLLAPLAAPGRVCVVADDTVERLYGQTLCASLRQEGFFLCNFTFAAGEKAKDIKIFSELLNFFAEQELTRSDTVIALGGGVTGDLTGFAAACYLRGVPYIQIPTTLLSAVDSSVGGKTGVNLAAGKNLAGAFWQPSLVLCDLNTLASLPDPFLLDGVAEMIKYGMLFSQEFFASLAQRNLLTLTGKTQKEQDFLAAAVERCVCIKRDIVSEDERDTGRRQLLNFGHTIGHAIEKCSDYRISHGQAVAMGMVMVSKAAFKSGLSSVNCAPALEKALKQYGFSMDCPYTAAQLSDAALKDKKRMGKTITLVIPHDIGDCRLEKIDIKMLQKFIGEGL